MGMNQWKEVHARYPKKSNAEYDELFEDLMEYTDFTNVNDIKTKEDLNSFFSQLEKGKNGKAFRRSSLRESLSNAWNRLKGGDIPRKAIKIIGSGKSYESFESAKRHGMTARLPDGREVYKALEIEYIDEKGNIITDENIRKKLRDERIRNPNKFTIIRE